MVSLIKQAQNKFPHQYFTFLGKLANTIALVKSRRLTKTSKNTLTPFYGVELGNGTQVNSPSIAQGSLLMLSRNSKKVE
jgi:hypothetical protein